MDTPFMDASGPAPESVLERLSKTNPGLEIWWDSSPLVYARWMNQMLEAAAPEKRPVLAQQLQKWYDPQDPGKTLFRGVTTNPPLSLAAMQDNPARWSAWIGDFMKEHPGVEVDEVYWALYKEIVRLGAASFQPVFESSGHLYGHLSAQVDPRFFFDEAVMLKQALDLSTLGPNVMIKVPGTRQGLAVLRALTARGIPTNCTAAYIVPQFVTVAEAILEGLAEARRNEIDLSCWRSVVTDMSARWENSPAFDEQAEAVGIHLSPEDKRWAGVAIFKNACRIFNQRAYPSKMLICSVRMGPVVDGVMYSWHLQETAGASAVFTLPPNFLTELFTQGEHLEFERRIDHEIPAYILQRLNQVPYFVKSYHPDGMGVDEFNDLPPLQATYKEFSKATEKMVTFVREQMQAHELAAAVAA